MRWSFFKPVIRSLSGPTTRKPRRQALRGSIDVLEDRSVPSATVLVAPRPIAANDWMDTDGSTPVTVAVLANDTPAPNMNGGASASLVPSSVQLAVGAHHGKATVNHADGTITYIASQGFNGSDTFAYTVRDASGVRSLPARVTIRVNTPVAADDWTDTDAGNAVTINVLANDADPDGNSHIQQPGSVAVATQPAHGTATILDPTSNQITYTPAAGFGGTDSFTYTVTDDHGATSPSATVFVRVNRPTANDDKATFVPNSSAIIAVLANDTDPDGPSHIGQPGSVALLSQPAHGTATLNANQVTYTPSTGFTGTDSFQYTVTDDNGATSTPGTVTIVGETPPAPGLHDVITDTDGRTPVSMVVATVDPIKGRAGTLTITLAPKHGHATVDGKTGEITYQAAAGFGGTDSFDYRAKLVGGGIETGTITVVVNRPTAADDWTDTDAGHAVTFDVLANDTDPDSGDHIHQPGSVKIVAQPAHGKATVDTATDQVTYTPKAGYGGTDSFQYTVTDDKGATSAPATAFVRVNRPTAADDEAETNGTTAVVINVLANDTDPDGNSHIQYPGSVTLLTHPAHGSATIDPTTNQVTYTARTGFVGTDTFRYLVTDDNGAASRPATVTVVVDGPRAASASFRVSNSEATLYLLGTPPKSGETVTIVRGPAHGSLMVDRTTGKVTYIGGAGFRQDSFQYTVTDASGVVSTPGTIDLISSMRIL